MVASEPSPIRVKEPVAVLPEPVLRSGPAEEAVLVATMELVRVVGEVDEAEPGYLGLVAREVVEVEDPATAAGVDRDPFRERACVDGDRLDQWRGAASPPDVTLPRKITAEGKESSRTRSQPAARRPPPTTPNALLRSMAYICRSEYAYLHANYAQSRSRSRSRCEGPRCG
jgi:hypothetical protein